MADATSGRVQEQLQKLLDETRREAERYASAHYRREGQEGRSGLGMRLEALEAALLKLAHEIDQVSADVSREPRNRSSNTTRARQSKSS